MIRVALMVACSFALVNCATLKSVAGGNAGAALAAAEEAAAKLKKAKGTDLLANLVLVDSALATVDTGANPTNLKKFPVPGRGAFAFQVSAASGTGGYVLTTSAKFPAKLGAKGFTDLSFDFAAPDGTLVKARVKPSLPARASSTSMPAGMTS